MSYGDGIKELLNIMLATIIVSVPLAIWKLIEIFIWLFTKVEVTIK